MSSLREIKSKIEACKAWDEPVPEIIMQEYRRLLKKFRLPKIYRREIEGLQRAWKEAGKSPAKDRYLPFLSCLYTVGNAWRARGDLERILKLAARQYRLDVEADIFKFCLNVGAVGQRLDRRTHHRWLCVVRYANAFDVPPKRFRQTIKAVGGVNACARRWQIIRRLYPR
ncbi:MAG: hypothetical protein IPK23_15765 [Rhizobiales bacterium]|nr:hypothetical protein [Hyphomicrobiales bacterium]